jgi:branched-subunit amino acid ABC-type transport system permease component
MLSGGVSIFGGVLPVANIFAMVFAALIGIALYVVIYRTRIGILVRAAAADGEMTDALGVPVDRAYGLVFMAACWLAGVGGVISTLLTPVYLGSDMEIILAAFIIVIVGGMGSILGSLVGSIIYGIVFALGLMVLPTYALVFLYVLMVLVLIFRPWGLLGKPR